MTASWHRIWLPDLLLELSMEKYDIKHVMGKPFCNVNTNVMKAIEINLITSSGFQFIHFLAFQTQSPSYVISIILKELDLGKRQPQKDDTVKDKPKKKGRLRAKRVDWMALGGIDSSDDDTNC